MYASFSPHIIIIEQHCSGEKRTTQFVLEYTMCVFKKNTPSFHSHSHFYIYEIVLIHMMYGVFVLCCYQSKIRGLSAFALDTNINTRKVFIIYIQPIYYIYIYIDGLTAPPSMVSWIDFDLHSGTQFTLKRYIMLWCQPLWSYQPNIFSHIQPYSIVNVYSLCQFVQQSAHLVVYILLMGLHCIFQATICQPHRC